MVRSGLTNLVPYSPHLLFCCSLASVHLKAEAQVWTHLGIVNILFAVWEF